MSDLIERMKLLELDHASDGWPAVQMKDIAAMIARVRELEAELSRYKAGVEVEGLVFKHAELLDESLAQFNGQRVRVLVIPEDRIVDANKTMKEVE